MCTLYRVMGDVGERSAKWNAFSSASVDFLGARRTVRKFQQGGEVPKEAIRKAVEVGQRASTSSWIQGSSVISVEDEDLKRRLLAVPGLNQSQNHESAALLFICADARRHMLIADAAGEPFSPNLESLFILVCDASLFAERMVAAFEAMGFGICYCGAVRERLPEVDAMLALPVGVFPLYAVAVGVPDGIHPSEWKPNDASLRPRLPVDAVLMTDAYISDEAMKEHIIKHDEVAAGYYTTRSSIGAPKAPVRAAPEPAAANPADEKLPARTWSGTDFQLEKKRVVPPTWKSMLEKFARPARSHLLSFFTTKGANFEEASQALNLGTGGFRRVRKYSLAASAVAAETDVLHTLSAKLTAAVDGARDGLTKAAAEIAAKRGAVATPRGAVLMGRIAKDLEDESAVVILLDVPYRALLDAVDSADSIVAFFSETGLGDNLISSTTISLAGADVGVPRGSFVRNAI